jgi:hypothetical protein
VSPIVGRDAERRQEDYSFCRLFMFIPPEMMKKKGKMLRFLKIIFIFANET